MPRDRVWNVEVAQKCERCGTKNLPCGPNLLRENDPGFTRRADNCHEGQSTTSTASPSEIAGSLPKGHEYPSPLDSNHRPDDDDTGTMSILFSEEKEGNSAEKLKVEALAKYTIPYTLYCRGLIVVTNQTQRTERLGRIFEISVSCFGDGLRTPPG